MNRKENRRRPPRSIFLNGRVSFVAVLRRLYREARENCPSLLRVVEHDPTHDVTGPELLARHGFADYEHHFFELTNDGGTAAQGNAGGHLVVLRDRGGRYRTAIFVKKAPATAADIEAQAVINVVIFLHERGHLDDVENRLHIVPGKPLDVAAAELHAHRYACREIVARGLTPCLGEYVHTLIPHLLRSGVENVVNAARAFVESDEYPFYVSLLGKTFEEWWALGYTSPELVSHPPVRGDRKAKT